MMNLAEYRNRNARLADYLPWAALVGPGIVLNKDGSFQRTAGFRGPDLDSAVAAELVAVAGRINNAFRRLGSGWAIFVEAQRSEAATYPDSRFPDPASALLDAERKAAFEEAGTHFVSGYFLTFLWLPPAEDAARAETWLYEGREQSGVNPWELMRGFVDRTDRVLSLLDGFMPECRWLDDAETLTYLHSTVSTNRQRLRVPEVPMHLDARLADQPLTAGLEPCLGDQHLRILTLTGFPSATTPGLLDEMNRLPFPYRWSTRAILLDKTDGFDKMGVGKVGRELMRALGDFTAGRAEAGRSPRLTPDEKAAMQDAYDRGTIDKSEAHDLAGVAESGVEYSDIRMRVMKPISFLFHHTERMNREVTFLAAYRLARGRGYEHNAAVQKAADLTWKAHFDYQNTSRPRLMQSDVAKVLLVFRNFNINMLWRLFRDAHQIFKGKTPEERREARMQLIGITSMMLFHAGVRGTWGYGLLMMFAGMFAGGSDEVEDEIKEAVVNTFGAGIGGAILNGVPGHLTGIDLVSRMGMADLWFRSSDRQLEGDDEYTYFMEQMLGAVPGMAQNMWRGYNQITEDGNVWRGIETAAPKALRDLMKGGRYLTEGVTTYSGEAIFEDVSPGDAFIQAMGFTPAQIAERYEANTRLKNAERNIVDQRRSIMGEITDAIRNGEVVPPEALARVQEFNAEYPSYPITSESIMQSLRAKIRNSQSMEGGIRLNPRLDTPLRLAAPPPIY